MKSPDLLLSAEIPERLNTLVFMFRISVLRGQYKLNSWLYDVFLCFSLVWDKKLALFEESSAPPAIIAGLCAYLVRE
jgi:hypothetical protein